MLNRAAVEIVALGGRGQAGGGGADERADEGRFWPRLPVVGETHPHRRLGLEDIDVGRRCCLATVFGRPICTNMCRLEVKLIGRFRAGEAAGHGRSDLRDGDTPVNWGSMAARSAP